MKKKFKQYLIITLGVILMDIGYYFFYVPTSIVIGGVNGIAIIADSIFHLEYLSLLIFILNAIALILSLIFVSKEFFFNTLYASLLSPVVIFIFEFIDKTFFENHEFNNFFYNDILENRLIICAICGALLTAYGLGICLRNNSSTGGMDVFQKIITKYLKVPYSIAMYSTDILIIIIGYFFDQALTFEVMIIGVISTYVIGMIIDIVVLNGKSRRTAYIITKHPEEVKHMIYSNTKRGLTLCNVVGGYTNDNYTMIICTLDKNESYKIKVLIESVDPQAFTFFSETKEVIGEY